MPDGLRDAYDQFRAADATGPMIERAVALSGWIDHNLSAIRDLYPKGDSGFSYFRGTVLEEVVLRMASLIVASLPNDRGLITTKLSTGQGIIAGVSLQMSRDYVPEPVRLTFRRDREDVTIGFRRTVEIYDETPAATRKRRKAATDNKGAAQLEPVARLPDEIVPACIIACKMYIDATRLENVIAKASNFAQQYARCSYLVAAELDSLGQDEFHDSRGRVVESLYAPIREMIFLRGDDVRRKSGQLVKQVQAHPYQRDKLMFLEAAIRTALSEWTA